LNPKKQHKKLVRLTTKAELCLSRKEAKKIISKADKAQSKLSSSVNP